MSGKTAKIADTMLSMLRRSLYVGRMIKFCFPSKGMANSLVGVSIRTVFVQIYICKCRLTGNLRTGVNWKTLLWWLGPWCNQQKAPKNVVSEDFTVSSESIGFRFRVYSGPVRNGAVLVLPGLHPDGLDDDRMDRFCTVLARSGAVIGVPELPTMMQSVMVPQLLDDTEAAAQFFTYSIYQLHQETFGVFVFRHLQLLVCIWLDTTSGLL